jgi:ATP-dependent exoDNAse (exonuclease V) beta subunit
VSGKREGVFDYDAVRAAEMEEDDAERKRLYYVAMTRAIDRLIVSGAIDIEAARDRKTPIGWVLERLKADAEVESAPAGSPFELERGEARFLLRVDRCTPKVEAAEPVVSDPSGQLALFAEVPEAPIPRGYRLPDLEPPPAPPLHRVKRLSYSALALFERCSYRYYAERVAGLREERAIVPGAHGLAATEIGNAVHKLLELASADVEVVREWYPKITDEEVERVAAFVRAYRESEIAARVASLEGVLPERPFAFEHDGVLLHGFLDLLWLHLPRALVVDYKTNSLAEGTPEEIVEHDYTLQRLVYALACFRAGAEEVEVVYQFLVREQMPELEAQLSKAIAQINAGEFTPTPSEFNCSGCPALDLVCAGPRLRQPPSLLAVG